MKGVILKITREMHLNRNVDAICAVMVHCSGCSLYEVGWYGGSCRPIKVNGKT
jgi:hypothetical protein